MSQAPVSFVVATHNRGKQLTRCLDSIKRQDYSNARLIVVDDASSDETAELVRTRYPDARLLRLERNLGVPGARNHGIAASSDDICLCIDDDARLIDPGATRRIVDLFARDPRLACVACRIVNGQTGEEEQGAIPRLDKRSIDHDYECSYFCGAGFALRRSAFLEVGAFFDSLYYGGEETDLSYRLIDRGYRLRYLPAVTVLHDRAYRKRPGKHWIYYNARNRCWIGLRNLPWRYVVSMTLLWWLRTGIVAIRERELLEFSRAVVDACAGIPQVARQRRCIAPSTRRKIAALSGRLWC